MKSRASTSVVMFDVLYEDGTRSSNRKVSASALGGLDGDEPARGIIGRSTPELRRIIKQYLMRALTSL